MSNKLRIKLIIVLAICMFACAFAGCSIGLTTYEEFLEEYNIAAQVTYYGNGGYFSENTAILSVEISYLSGSKIYTPTEGTAAQQIKRSNYDLAGWYNVEQRTYIETGDDGEDEEVLYFVLDVTDEELAANTALVKEGNNYYFEYTSELSTGDDDDDEDTSDEEFDEDAEIDTSYLTQRMYYIKDGSDWIMSQEDYDYYVRLRKEYNTDTTISVPNLVLGTEMDSTQTLEDGAHLYMVADWTKSVSINYYLAMKEGETATSINITVSGETTTVSDGGLLYQEYFGTQTSITRSDVSGLPSSITFEDATLLAFYYDKDCTLPVNGASIEKPEEDIYGNVEDVTIYAQCVAGIYTVVRDAAGVASMFNSGSTNYYIYSDIDVNPDLDSGTILYTVSPFSAFRGEIRGNGYTIYNLAVSKTNVGSKTALFGILYDGATITDLTIDTVQIEYQTTTAQAVNIYLVAIRGQDATDIDITGLTLKNVDVKITLAERSGGEYTLLRNMQYVEVGQNTGVYEYESDNWLYGDNNIDDVINYTDNEFITAYGNVTLENCTVYIREGIEYDISGEELDTYVKAVSTED